MTALYMEEEWGNVWFGFELERVDCNGTDGRFCSGIVFGKDDSSGTVVIKLWKVSQKSAVKIDTIMIAWYWQWGHRDNTKDKLESSPISTPHVVLVISYH